MFIDRKLSSYLAFRDATVVETLRKIGEHKGRIVFVVDENRIVDGVVTNGDILQWLVKADTPDLGKPITEVANRNFRFAKESSSPEEVQAILEDVLFVPILNEQGQLVAVARRDYLRSGIQIGERRLGDGQPCYVIAEIGNNHNGDFDTAKRLVDAAVAAGVDCAKFQMRQMHQLYAGFESGVSHGENLGAEYTLDLLSRFQLSNDELFKIFDYCKSMGVEPLCTPWDSESLGLLEQYGMQAYKVASADFTNHGLLRSIAETGKTMICSTGMTSESEVDETIAFLQRCGAGFALLHCNSTYPAPLKDIHLRYISRLKSKGDFPVGYSGHERGIHASVAAVALGANLLERHLTLDRSMEGSDHKASLLPNELVEMVIGIREVEQSLGNDGSRNFSQGEMMNRVTLAKSLIINCSLKKGETICDEMVEVKSPGRGLQPMYRGQLVGRTAKRDLKAGDFFFASDIENEVVVRRKYQFPQPWGLPVRYHDANSMAAGTNPDLLEFHLSYKDMTLECDELLNDRYDCDLVVHSPELFQGDHTLDLCSLSESYRERSISELQRVIDLTNHLKSRFTRATRPLIITNVGGFSEREFLTPSEREGCYHRLLDSLSQLDTTGVEIIPQTMPPFPWHFGGQRFHNLFVEPEWIRRFCVQHGYRICFDTSHTMLACNHYGWSFFEATKSLAEHTAHFHIADAAGSGEEGLQIGCGEMDLPAFANLVSQLSPTASFIPEIWQGHENGGEGFWIALEKLETLFSKSSVCSPARQFSQRAA